MVTGILSWIRATTWCYNYAVLTGCIAFLSLFIFAGLLGLNRIHCYLGQLEDAACQSRIFLSMAQARLGSAAMKGRGASAQRLVASSEAEVTSSGFGQGEKKG